jgi:hypothetical protein
VDTPLKFFSSSLEMYNQYQPQTQQQQKLNPSSYYNQMQQQQLHHSGMRMGIDPTMILKEDFPMEMTSPTQPYYSVSVPLNYPVQTPMATSFNSYSQSPMTMAGIEEEGQSYLSTPQNGSEIDVINEKRRKRRESHNAVERRRRDHINEKIQELSSLLPEFASDQQNKPNKGTILKRSVEYIRHMQLFAARQMDRTLELEQCLMRLVQERGLDEAEFCLSIPLGTPIQLPAMVDTPDEL